MSCPLRLEDFPVLKPGELGYKMNPTKTFGYREENKRLGLPAGYIPLVPQPFNLNAAWEEKTFTPALGDILDEDNIAVWFNSLILEENVRIAYGCYESSPENDLKVSQPCLAEPEVNSELHLLTRNLYGLETLSRTTLNVHPGRLPRSLLLSTLDEELTPGVVTIDESYQLEESIIHNHVETIAGEAAGITCPVCIPPLLAGRKIGQIPKWTRLNYVRHYRQHHLSSICALTAFVETGTSQRLFEGFVLYISCLSNAICNDELKEMKLPPPTRYTGILDQFHTTATEKRRKEVKHLGVGKKSLTARANVASAEESAMDTSQPSSSGVKLQPPILNNTLTLEPANSGSLVGDSSPSDSLNLDDSLPGNEVLISQDGEDDPMLPVLPHVEDIPLGQRPPKGRPRRP